VGRELQCVSPSRGACFPSASISYFVTLRVLKKKVAPFSCTFGPALQDYGEFFKFGRL